MSVSGVAGSRCRRRRSTRRRARTRPGRPRAGRRRPTARSPGTAPGSDSRAAPAARRPTTPCARRPSCSSSASGLSFSKTAASASRSAAVIAISCWRARANWRADLVDRARVAGAAAREHHLEDLLDRRDPRERAGRVAPARAGGDAEFAREVRARARKLGEADERLAQQLARLLQRRAAHFGGQRERVDAGALAQRDEAGPQLLVLAPARRRRRCGGAGGGAVRRGCRRAASAPARGRPRLRARARGGRSR